MALFSRVVRKVCHNGPSRVVAETGCGIGVCPGYTRPDCRRLFTFDRDLAER